jgi:hypothetical protein
MSSGWRSSLSRGAVATSLAGVLWMGSIAPSVFAQVVPDRFERRHENGLTTLRFHKGLFHYALVLDAAPRENAAALIVTADGRRIALRSSGRSVWIDAAKFELPFGAVFLVSTKDSTRVRQLEFNAMRGRLVLDQAAAAAPVAAWLGEHGDLKGEVVRGAVEAATYPRHTLELTEWTYRGVNAVTCVVSGSPLFVLLSMAPLDGGSSTQTFFGNLASLEVQVGSGEAKHSWVATPLQATFMGRTYDLAKGRVFLIPPSGAEVTQVATPLDLGLGAAERLADEIERIPEVRELIRLR